MGSDSWTQYTALLTEREKAEDELSASYDAYMRAKQRFDRLDRQASDMFRRMMDRNIGEREWKRRQKRP